MNPKLTLRSIPYIFLFIVTFALLTYLLTAYDWNKRDRIGTSIPDEYPVLVMSRSDRAKPYRADVVQYSKLVSYTRSVRDYTFLVPDNAKQMPLRCSRTAAWGLQTFNVEKRDRDRQFINVAQLCGHDSVRLSWYTAEPKRIKPSYYRCAFLPPFMAVLSAPFALIINTVMWLFIGWVCRLHRRQVVEIPSQ